MATKTTHPDLSGPPISISGLSKTYRLGFLMNKRVRALQGLDLQVESGQVYGLLGPNGAGKSTTIKILMNLVRPSDGTARLFGRSPSEVDARRSVGFLPENPAPYEYLTGQEFVRLCGRLAGLSGQELDDRVSGVLARVEMHRAAHLQIRRYSKGMVQRIALAQAIVHSPRLLILDEPTSGLDPLGRRLMRDIIFDERAKGTAVLFCTHIIPDIEALCDRVAVLVGGKRVQEGGVRELLAARSAAVEVTVEGLSQPAVESLAIPLDSIQQVGQQLLLRTGPQNKDRLVNAVLERGGRINQLQLVHFSLEDLFLDTLKEAGHTVGGELS